MLKTSARMINGRGYTYPGSKKLTPTATATLDTTAP
jgi:hypothetical protein